jgi:serine/threonine protein kinase
VQVKEVMGVENDSSPKPNDVEATQ